MRDALEINFALWGYDRLRGDGDSSLFRACVLVNKPSNELDGGPDYPDQPSEGGDASQS